MTVEDPRVERTKAHALLDIIITAICAVLCGADGWVDEEACGKTTQDWLAPFLALYPLVRAPSKSRAGWSDR
ncbi:MAG: transposase family protein [Chloroflexales bacterium]